MEEQTKIQVNISQIAVEEYCLSFYSLDKWNLDNIRDSIYDMIEMAADEPELSEDPQFMEELTMAFEMRQALLQLNKLHDA